MMLLLKMSVSLVNTSYKFIVNINIKKMDVKEINPWQKFQ